MNKKKVRRYPDRYKHVSLRMCGKDKNFDPEIVSKLLNLKPDVSQPGQEIIKTIKDYNRIYNDCKHGVWVLRSRIPRNCSLQKHVEDILKQITPRRKALEKILKNYAIADLTIAVQPNENLCKAGYYFPAKLLNGFTSLGIDINFSYWIPSKP